MKRFLNPLLAVLLTIPMFLVMTRIDMIPAWLYSDHGYAVLSPLFRLVGAVGVEGDEDVIVGILLVASFVVSSCAVWLGMMLFRKIRRPMSHSSGKSKMKHTSR